MSLIAISIGLKSILYDTNQFGFDCLFYSSTESAIDNIIKFCIDPENQNQLVNQFYTKNHQRFTFKQLKDDNVTSTDILLWSSSIDLAELYEYYLRTPDSSILSNEVFVNCSGSWFGSQCHYSLETINEMEYERNSVGMSMTCYTLLECDRGGKSICLDWREVCNGRVDCLNDGIDERECFRLEINECKQGEYRCKNGLCISQRFNEKIMDYPECLDQTDLLTEMSCSHPFYSIDIFTCEEFQCPPDQGQFVCGDGLCVDDFDKCENERHTLLIESLINQENSTNDCWSIMICLTKIFNQVKGKSCDEWLQSNDSTLQFSRCPCPMEFPRKPILYGHIRFLFCPNEMHTNSNLVATPKYICYNERLCDHLPVTYRYETLTCRHANETGFQSDLEIYNWKSMIDIVKRAFHGCTTQHYENLTHYHSSMYSCKNSSKVISKHRVIDQISDCALNDDEFVSNLTSSIQQIDKFECFDQDHCKLNYENDGYIDNLLFNQICDRTIDISPIIIDGKIHTDETNCELWPCNNIYTRCDGFWTCPDGDDENNCLCKTFPQNLHPCISPYNKTLMFLPSHQVVDGAIDCLGASDEPQLCRKIRDDRIIYNYRCWNSSACISQRKICNGFNDCQFNDDEMLCNNSKTLCTSSNVDTLNDEQYVLCKIGFMHRVSFPMKSIPFYPPRTSSEVDVRANQPVTSNINSSSSQFILSERCFRKGISANVRFENGNFSQMCFCRPNYYGNFCQYQNQRVSLTLVLSINTHNHVYGIIVTLFEDDNDREEIQSFYQFTSIAKQSCGSPISFYLSYSTRPKNISKHYSIRIDAFDKLSLKYVSSWLLSIPFVFLPVNRLTAIVTLPIHYKFNSKDCTLKCYQGFCMKYVNVDRYFCSCYSGWTGVRCHLKANCDDCSANSKCVGSVRHQSICLCPFNTFGSRCFLNRSCPQDFCKNNGLCVVKDNFIADDPYVCVCSELFDGLYCHKRKNQLQIHLKNMPITSNMVAHFFASFDSEQPTLAFSQLRTITMFQDILVIYDSTSYNMVFLEINQNYYLAVAQQSKVTNVSTVVSDSQYCPSINQLFHSNILKLPWIQRIKYYHQPCQRNVNLQCFVDEYFICLCTLEHQSNCFQFERRIDYRCKENVHCENGGTCLQDHHLCPYTMICVCSGCFFGDRCQFYAKTIGSTLDDILRYSIQPHLRLYDQSYVVKFTLVFTTILLVIGILNSVLSYLTFYHRNSRTVGCGVYLLISSIGSLLTVIVLTIKVLFVVITHINPSMNRTVLRTGCLLIEPILKFLLHLSNWLNAFVAIERGISAFLGAAFVKKDSRRVAKRIIAVAACIILVSVSHEFFFRDLFDDEEENRLWCVFRYTHPVAIYSQIILWFHFAVPFIINLFSAIFIIFIISRRRNAIHTQSRYKKHIRKQFYANKQLLISPIILVILSFPRFIISLLSECVKSSRDPWLYLTGYFISFIPPTFVCVIFVLPSTLYRRQLSRSINDLRLTISS